MVFALTAVEQLALTFIAAVVTAATVVIAKIAVDAFDEHTVV